VHNWGLITVKTSQIIFILDENCIGLEIHGRLEKL
jgi:hypothetical protein